MKDRTRTIYTIGYAKLKPPELLKLAEGLDVTVVDVRGKPVSRQPGWGGNQLAALLGDRYVWHGDMLGGVRHLANARQLWPAGVRRMLKVERPMLLCQCHAPQSCHRHQLADMITDTTPTADVVHLYGSNAIETRELFRAWIDHDKASAYKWGTAKDLLALESTEGRW